MIVGWGGTKLDETVTFDPANPPSLVFPGEQASNAELAKVGYNAWRLSFAPFCVKSENNFMGVYDPGQVQRGITIAKDFNFWIIIDYHGYTDLSSARRAQCWLDFWKTILQRFKDSYDRIVWEPFNEPTGLGGERRLPEQPVPEMDRPGQEPR